VVGFGLSYDLAKGTCRVTGVANIASLAEVPCNNTSALHALELRVSHKMNLFQKKWG
jgi:hypothetical protein